VDDVRFIFAYHEDEPLHKSESQGLHAVRSAGRLACHVLGARTADTIAQNTDF
jgi:hypothetical protein